jgi:hypothetical protein
MHWGRRWAVKGIRGHCQAFPRASVNSDGPGMLFAPHLNLP